MQKKSMPGSNRVSPPPLVVLDEHPDWLQPLYDEFTRRKIPYKKVDISSAAYNPLEANAYPFYVNRLSPSASKRGHETAFTYTLNYLRYLESLGIRVLNGSHTVLLETSKADQAALLRRLSIPTPKTVVFNNPQQIIGMLEEFHFPVVIKPNCGGSGIGIQRFSTKEELEQAIKNEAIILPPENLAVLQEFIQPKDGHIVRVETINGKVVYSMKVFTQGTFNLCPSDGCDIDRGGIKEEVSSDELGYCVATPSDTVRFELYSDLPIEIETAVERLVREAGLEVAGIEYVVDSNNNWYIYDINALSILRSSFKEEYGIDAWGLLADFFEAEYRKAVK